jgi:hypothetical protein
MLPIRAAHAGSRIRPTNSFENGLISFYFLPVL